MGFYKTGTDSDNRKRTCPLQTVKKRKEKPEGHMILFVIKRFKFVWYVRMSNEKKFNLL